LTELDDDARRLPALTPLLPVAADLVELYEARVRVEPMDAQDAAGRVTAAHKSIAALRAKLDAGTVRIAPALAGEAAAALDAIRFAMNDWYTFYNGYDPLFTWW